MAKNKGNDKKVEQITDMEVDFAQWFTDVCKKAQLIDYSSIKGVFIYRPYGYAIWENIQRAMDDMFKATGHENVMMPMLYSGTPRIEREERAHEALRRVGLSHRIGFLPGTLSGGERQRISIARALLKNAPIVLLDEATASLDVENETKVQRALSRLLSGRTVLVIAHRMRTVQAADHIVVLADGKVAEEGRPEELLQKDGSIFRHMTELQTASAGWSI